MAYGDFDYGVPTKYIEGHYQPQDWLCALLLYREGATTTARPEYGYASDFAKRTRLAHFAAANAHGADIYLSVNAFTPGLRSRERGAVQHIRHLFSDIDQRGGYVLHSIQNSRLPKPHTIMSSSNGKYQVLWRVSGFTPDIAEATGRGMAHEFQADQTVWDAERVLRVPGFANNKYTRQNGMAMANSIEWVKLVQPERPGLLTPEQFPRYLDLEQQINEQKRWRTAHTVAQKPLAEGRDRSAEDWGLVMRKLENGERPEVIKAWLAERRSDKHKPTPAYYAENTVNNAVRYFEQKYAQHLSRGQRL